MKSPLLLIGLLVPLTVLSAPIQADEPISQSEAEDLLREAICLQDWNEAEFAASVLIAQSTVSNPYRSELMSWRSRFSDYRIADTKFDEIPNCEGVVTAADSPAEVTALPSLSTTSLSAHYYCYEVETGGSVQSLESMCTGQAPPLPAPSPPPAILANGELECIFASSADARSFARQQISVPVICTALTDIRNASIESQILANNRVLGTHSQLVRRLDAGEQYAYDSFFQTDYAPRAQDTISVRFLD
ncbi:MAG: hypothetical protein AAFN18_23675 [Cyanobacteria bacterium J06554_6]